MQWINELRQKARDKWIEWNNVQLGTPEFSKRDANLSLYTGMIRMADVILLNDRMYDLKELNRVRASPEFVSYLHERIGKLERQFHFLRRHELDIFMDFLAQREKNLPKYKPLIIQKKKFVVEPTKKRTAKKEVS